MQLRGRAEVCGGSAPKTAAGRSSVASGTYATRVPGGIASNMTAQPPPVHPSDANEPPGPAVSGVTNQALPSCPMDLTYPPESEAFRSQIRAWLEENLPDGWGAQDFSMDPDDRKAFNRNWVKKLHAGGWICASWPEEYGGKGLSLMEQVVLNEEFAKAKAPLRADFFGDTLVGPTILQWGTEEQKRSFIPRILDGTISWCQGFSEPDSGSDLASLSTRAELDGDEWVITGQKVWTTQAQFADYIFLLARTDPEAPKHAGISYLLVPMKQDGIEVRPIQQIDSSSEFNEVFFSGARCPRDNVVGGVNNGWKVAMTTLGFERGASATTGFRRFARELEGIVDQARRLGRNEDPLVRQGLARAWSKVKIMEVNGYRSLTDSLERDPQRGRPGRGQQDVLVRVPPRDDGARHLDPRARGPDPHRIGRYWRLRS